MESGALKEKQQIAIREIKKVTFILNASVIVGAFAAKVYANASLLSWLDTLIPVAVASIFIAASAIQSIRKISE